MVLFAFVASCVRETRPPEVAADLAIPPIGHSSLAPTTPEAPKQETCHATVLAGPISKSSWGCIIDEQITKHQGILTFPCDGDGDAEATFGEQVYTGRIEHGEIDLEAKTELEWPGDGCRWGTTANIRGAVAANRPQLSWSYRDYVVRGTACSGTCTATSIFAVRLQKLVKPQPGDGDDDDR
jgi:hypothetical protein